MAIDTTFRFSGVWVIIRRQTAGMAFFWGSHWDDTMANEGSCIYWGLLVSMLRVTSICMVASPRA